MNKEAAIDIQQEIKDLENQSVLKSELPIKEKYLSALKNGDTEKINEYLESGAFPHSRITNRSNYEYALKAGFKAPFKLSEDWFEWPRINYKTISFKVNANDTLCNEIYYGKLPNGKWVSDESHRTGNAGGGGTPSIFDKQHDSKESAIRFALDSLKNKLQEGLKEAIRDTCGNYNVKYIKKVLSIISEYEAKQTEPTAEQTFHCDYCKQSFPYKDENDKLTGFFDAGTKHSVCWSCSDLHYETTQSDKKETNSEPEFNRPVGEFWESERPFLYIGQMSSGNTREIWFYDVIDRKKITVGSSAPPHKKILFYGINVANIVPMYEWPSSYLENLPVYEFKDKRTAKGYGLKTNHKIQLVIEWNKECGLFRFCEHVFRNIPFAELKQTTPEPIKTAKVDGLTQIVMPFEVEEVKQKRDPNAELYGYQAKDKTDRQRFKRKLERTRQWLAELSPEEARAIKKMVSEMTTPPPLGE